MNTVFKGTIFALALVLMGQGCPAPSADIESDTQADVMMEDKMEKKDDGAMMMEDETKQDDSMMMDDGAMKEDSGAMMEVKTDIEAEVDAEVVAGLNVSMESGNFFFTPSTINAKAGQEVTVSIEKNSGFHTFVIDEIGFKKTIRAGESFTFTAPSNPGSYAYYCDVGNHRALGMEGTLIVQ